MNISIADNYGQSLNKKMIFLSICNSWCSLSLSWHNPWDKIHSVLHYQHTTRTGIFFFGRWSCGHRVFFFVHWTFILVLVLKPKVLIHQKIYDLRSWIVMELSPTYIWTGRNEETKHMKWYKQCFQLYNESLTIMNL